MDRIEISTEVYVPPEELYEFLSDFPRYANYSKYLKEVRANGSGESGTRYDLQFAWWKLSYTARSEVTGRDPPNQIDWRLVKDIDATGHWRIESAPSAAPPDRSTASRVFLVIEFDPDSADEGTVDTPRLISLDWVIEKVEPKILEEAERVVERVVADLEGQHRPVELTIHERP